MGLEGFISTFANHLAAGGVAAPTPVAKHYLAVVGRFSAMAVKWAAVSSTGARCDLSVSTGKPGVFRCGVPAAGVCSSCGRFTCIEHALVSARTGAILCDGCLLSLKGGSAPAAAPPATIPEPIMRLGYLHILGLRSGATMEEIKSSYRRLAQQNHPDKCESDGDSMKLINEAYDWLKSHQSEKEA